MTTHCFIHLLQPSLVWRSLQHLTHEVESNPDGRPKSELKETRLLKFVYCRFYSRSMYSSHRPRAHLIIVVYKPTIAGPDRFPVYERGL